MRIFVLDFGVYGFEGMDLGLKLRGLEHSRI